LSAAAGGAENAPAMSVVEDGEDEDDHETVCIQGSMKKL